MAHLDSRFALLALSLAACTGAIDATLEEKTPPPPTSTPAAPPRSEPSAMPPAMTPLPPPPPGPCTNGGAGPRRLARLTPQQLRNTLAVAFSGRASTARPSPALPRGIDIALQPSAQYSYSTYAGSHGLSEFEVRQSVQQTAATAAALVAQIRATGGSCLAAGSKVPLADCATQLVTTKGELLFRRPLSAQEISHYQNLWKANAATLGDDEALGLMFQAMLLAPQTLFRPEVGTAGRLDSHEVAAALSYALTDAPPDEELWAAARKDELRSDAAIRAQVARLLGTLDKPAVRRFLEELFEYEAVTTVFKTAPGYDRDVLYDEASAVVADVLKTNGRRDLWKTLLTTGVGFVHASTAVLYGESNLAKDETRRVSFPPTERAGILTHPAFLAAFSDMDHNEPVRRGRFLSEKILCRPVPELPIGQVPPLPPETANAPMRERLAVHRRDPACAACHDLMDPLGLAFEMYEHTGKRASGPVDASGVLTGSGDRDGRFNDATELVQRLAGSRTTERCFATASFRYWLGRDEGAPDACTISGAQAAYAESGGDYLALVQALFTSPSFLDRK